MKKLRNRLLTVTPILVLGFVCGILVGRYGLYAEESVLSGGVFGTMAVLFVGFVLAMYLQIAVHEAGHLVFGLLTEAWEAMEGLLARKTGMPGLYRSLLTCDLIFCRLTAGDETGARRLLTADLQRFLRSMKTYPTVLRTQYVLTLAEGDAAQAQKHLAAFEKMARRYPYPAYVESERELTALLEAAAV